VSELVFGLAAMYSGFCVLDTLQRLPVTCLAFDGLMVVMLLSLAHQVQRFEDPF
jgi:hypothetical protein